MEGLEDLHDRLRACGVDDPRAWDVWTAMLAGLAAQQNANEPGGDRWLRLADEIHRHVPGALRATDTTPGEGPIMIIEMLDVADIPALEHDEAMAVAAAEYDRLLELVDRLAPDDWTRRTDCPAGTSGTW